VDIGGDHRAAEGWTYGLADVWPERIRKSTRIANPGCYPAASLAALAPLVANKLVEPTGIIIDAKSGVSGAGRGGGTTFGFAEVNEDVSAYGLLKHAHAPEMTATLSALAGAPASITFTPHLIPMTRGILATCYADLRTQTMTGGEVRAMYEQYYDGEPFTRVVDEPPHSKWTYGSNLCLIYPTIDKRTGRLIVISCLDNLVKGASGQAIQNANRMFGLPETAGVPSMAVFP